MIRGPYENTHDEFHPPTDPGDHEWAETCWFAFTVPRRRLSGQLYAYFKPTLGVTAAAAYIWDDTGDQAWNCLYAKNFWHLPIPDEPLSKLTLANGFRHEVVEPGSRYAIGYDDPDGDEVHIALTFTGIAETHLLGAHHLDQPGRYTGALVLGGETIAIDTLGLRDRSWGRRSQFGPGINETPCQRGGYSFATQSAEEGFLAVTLDFGDGAALIIHGYLIADGVWSKLIRGERTVVRRDPANGAPAVVRLQAVDELGRRLDASGVAMNRLGYLVNPNLWSWNGLYEWHWSGITAYGEDHDNWSVTGQRTIGRQFWRSLQDRVR